MTYKNRYETTTKFGSRHPMVRDALKFARADMDGVLDEILAIDAIRIPHRCVNQF